MIASADAVPALNQTEPPALGPVTEQHRHEPDRAQQPERAPPEIGRGRLLLGRALGVESVQRLGGGGGVVSVNDQREVAVVLVDPVLDRRGRQHQRPVVRLRG